MKVGDMVQVAPTASCPWNEDALGVIVESREMAATRRIDRGKNTHCHQVYWTPSLKVVWVMERDLSKVIN